MLKCLLMNTFEPEDLDVFTVSLAETLKKRDGAYDAIAQYVDSAGEAWFDLGAKIKQRRILNLLDEFNQRLLDSEEDAKMTLAILRELIENDSEEEEDGAGE